MLDNQCSIGEIHDVELEILKFFRFICEKNGINYRLTYGTLLGAVRHRGFIPWDDDIDVAIPVEEVSKFRKCFEAENSKLFALVSPKNEKYSIEPWFKIRKNNTTSMPKNLKKIPKHWGVCIDVFPMFSVGKFKFAQTLKMKLFDMSETLLRANTAKYTDDASVGLRILGLFPTSFRRFISNLIVKYLYSGDESSEYISDGFAVFKRTEFFGKKTALSFENEFFAVPDNYDSILTEMYGDYMTPPPEEERVGHDTEHGDIIWSTKSGPEEYINS